MKTKQKLLALTEHKLIQDVQARWNSSFENDSEIQQLAIMSELSAPEIRKNVKDNVTDISNDDITQAEHAMTVLEPLKTVTTIMCSEQTPTVSLMYPMKALLLDSMNDTANDSGLIKEVKSAVRNDLQKRYDSDEMKEFLLVAAALDPGFKSLPRQMSGRLCIQTLRQRSSLHIFI
ncbi:hypothetical protein CI610_03214 [invertebrate metagenome]|uniref:Uncharacterized protein n=1 Tax=invertebrate metagenome TaxID=1711999 RepID=A0A2H9T3T6_9ZZZZ